MALLLAASACAPNARVSYAGKTRPAHERKVQIIEGRDAPKGYSVLGVVTSRCTSLDGSSGILEDPCTDVTLKEKALARAAEVGGDALVELVCGIEGTDQYLTTVDQGLPGTSERQFLMCRATVLVAEAGAEPPKTVTGKPDRVIDGRPYAVEMTGEAREGERLDASVVGVMDRFPDGYLELGRITVRCLKVCKRSSTERALVSLAAERGALSVAELSCELKGERWGCQARMVGEESTPERVMAPDEEDLVVSPDDPSTPPPPD